MKEEIKNLWVKKLGEVNQVFDRLHCDDGFCVMGALLDCYVEDKGLSWIKIGSSKFFRVGGLKPEDTMLGGKVSRIVLDWAGINQNVNYLLENQGSGDFDRVSIYHANDQFRVTFPEFIEFINDNWRSF